MKLPIALILTYQAEYETSEITLEALCDKYSIKQTQLTGCLEWEKRGTEIEVLTQVNELPETREPYEIIEPTKIFEDISEFKELAIAHALDFMKNNAKYAEVKELKDVVAIVDSIESSFNKNKQPQGPTVHIAIQNLVERFRDDC